MIGLNEFRSDVIEEDIQYKVVVPSYRRAGNVKTLNVFPDAILAVHEFEVKEYVKEYDNEIMVLPDALIGNMAKVRNYIRDNAGCRYLVMVDDDVKSIGTFERIGSERADRTPLASEEIDLLIRNGFVMAEQIKTVLWGVNVADDKRFYHAWKPISLTAVVLGTFCAHIITDEALKKIRYDERLSLNEDYDFSLQVLYHYRKILRFDKYSYRAEHITSLGGCGSYRTLDEEKNQAKLMKKKWGRVVQYDFSKSTNPRVIIPW